VEQAQGLGRVLSAEALLTSAPWKSVHVAPDAPAFLQFSSGTTLEPKAVVVSHAGLLHNLEMMDDLFRHFDVHDEAERGGVCWLPLYHDMGLVGCMFVGLYHPGTVTYIGPELFLAKPALWLQTLSRYRAVISPAPDFAYGLCLARVKDEDMEGVDLSHWKLALDGAEPIDPGVLDRFTQRFARWGFRAEALTPVYGLAEAGLAVTFADPWSPPRVTEFDRARLSERGEASPGTGRRLPSVGRPLPGVQVEIRDERGRRMEEDRVGRVMIKGPSVTTAYYNDPELTAQTVRHGWLDTGDLGFFHQGELYVSGRVKDLIIIRGRNYAPQEIEALAAGIPGVRTGCVAAVGHSVDGQGEQLVIFAEKDRRVPRPDEEIAAEIHARIVTGISLVPHRVEILAPGTLPRTSSGKMRRRDALQMFLSGHLVPPEKVRALEVVKHLGRSQLAWARFRLRRGLRRR
jgi:acyl-CoA synthetase (AMP-forming)/AMP-acid ligase II